MSSTNWLVTLVAKCERDEECLPSAIAHWRIAMAYACWMAMDTCYELEKTNIVGTKEDH